jgi:predicted Ser/Thr protein kinase
MPNNSGSGLPDEGTWQQVDAWVQRFEKAWQNDDRPDIDDFLPKDGPVRLAVLNELVHVDLERRLQVGEPVRTEDYLERYPELAPYAHPTQSPPSSQEQVVNAPGKPPQQIGRYRVESLLGQGGFGVVYLAHDDQLDRPVAIKVPHRKLVSRPEDAKAYLMEARTVANLDHPNIVPVHDVGSSEDYPCFIVSKFIEGSSLAQKIKEDRPSLGEATAIVATIAEALHYAHRKGLVHRDIKPGNIMVGTSGKPFVVDFGLALKEENVGHGPKYAGVAKVIGLMAVAMFSASVSSFTNC